MNLIHCQFDSSLTVDILDIDLQGSHSDWKTWKNGQGKVREFLTDWKSQEKHTKYWKTRGISDKCNFVTTEK